MTQMIPDANVYTVYKQFCADGKARGITVSVIPIAACLCTAGTQDRPAQVRLGWDVLSTEPHATLEHVVLDCES